jgi:sterol 3beta-glucosyltransferase
MCHRIRHRDWYIDEGATDPITGMVAFGSGVATKSLSLVFDYEKSLSTSIRKKHNTLPIGADKGKESESSSSDAPLGRVYSPSWDIPVTQNPVTAALTYPPERLELFAAKLASKTYEHDPIQGQNSWLPKRTKSGLHVVKQEKEHGLAYEAAHETGDFGKGILVTGLRSKFIVVMNGVEW